MGDDVEGSKQSAGQNCPAPSVFPSSVSPEGCDGVRVFHLPAEKMGEIEWTLAGIQRPEVRGQKSEVKGQSAEGLKSEIKKWLATVVKLAGLVVVAACVGGELSPAPQAGQSIHAHGGHENKRQSLRRSGERRKDDDEPDNDDDGGIGCKLRVDLCEHRTEDGVCRVQQRLCRWVAATEPRFGNLANKATAEMLTRIDRKISAVQRDIGEMRKTAPAVPESVARQVFGVVREMETGGHWRKAPMFRVFRLYCMDGMTAKQVAKECCCSKSLVVLRLNQLRRKLGREPAELRVLTSHFEAMEESLTDSRAKRIHRESAMDEASGDTEDG